MTIQFTPLKTQHFPKLVAWLNTSLVNKWYGNSKKWTEVDVWEKYASYVEGYKVEEGRRKPIHAFIIEYEGVPLGYIQYYNAYDFPRDGYVLEGMPTSLAALDVFIGEETFLGRGIGSAALELFLSQHIWPQFEHCLVDPEAENTGAIKAYLKAGFKIFKRQEGVEILVVDKNTG